MTRSGSMCCSTPSPPHFGQAPNGLLNENNRGSISGMVKPEIGQANFSEKTRRRASAAAAAASFVFLSPSLESGGAVLSAGEGAPSVTHLPPAPAAFSLPLFGVGL